MRLFLNDWLRTLFIKCLCTLKVSYRILPVVMLPYALLRGAMSVKEWKQLLRYKDLVACADNSLKFLVYFFLRRSTDLISGMMIVENPEKFLPNIQINGQEYVQKLKSNRHGVLVISNHGGPIMLQTFLFTQIMGIPLGSFTNRMSRWAKKRSILLEGEKVFKSLPCYRTGEEKSLLKGLLSGGWVNMLLDTPMAYENANCRLLNRDTALSLFPFRVSIKHSIPLLFVGIVQSFKDGTIKVSIEPVENFSTSTQGLEQYAEKLERLLREDPYGNSNVPRWITR